MPYDSHEKRMQRQRERRAAARAAKTQQPVPVREAQSAAVIKRWASDNLIVPTGPLAGQPFQIADWQAQFLDDALAPDTREAGLSVARKNGKSGVIGATLLSFLAGPLNRPNWRGIVVSLTGNLAKELRTAMEQTAVASSLTGARFLRTPTPGRIEGMDGATLDFLAADKATGHAVGADLVIVDEAGLILESGRDLWNACLSSVSGRDGRLWAISVQGLGPMFSELGARGGNPGVVFQQYSCDADCDIQDPTEWHKSNPGLAAGIKSLRYMRDAARRAADNPPDQSAFRTLDLNCPGMPDAEIIIPIAEWRQCEVSELPARSGPCYVGLDIGGAKSLTGAAAYFPESGRLEVWGGVGGVPGLLERGQADGVGARYEQMQQRGELTAYPGVRETPVTAFLADVGARLAAADVVNVSADRYKQSGVEDGLNGAGLPGWIDLADWRGFGFRDGNADVTAFQRAVYGRRIAALPNLLLTSAISESKLTYDPGGNVKLDKQRFKSRIDGLSAAVLAVAAGERNRHVKPRRTRYLGLVG